MRVEATGHLIDSGILSKALDSVTRSGGHYKIVSFRIGATDTEPSQVAIEVSAATPEQLDQLLDNLGALGFSVPAATDARLAAVTTPGVAPDGFYSTTNLPTRVRVAGAWIDVDQQRMDATIVVSGRDVRCIKLRDLVPGQQVVLGHEGIRVTPDTKQREESDFAFMSAEVSSERRTERQAALLAGLWRDTKARGGRVVLVAGPVVVHTGQAPSVAALVHAGLVDAVLAGNALAVHDIEAALYGTSLGVALDTGEAVMHGHMNHMRAINAVRAAGGIAGAVASGTLKTGIMHALVTCGVPYSLAGSIRDDGPLPETEMDLIRAQQRYAELLDGASLVIVLGTMLHGIGVANMLPASVTLVCVDIHPAVVAKLADRGSSHTVPIVTDAGLFLMLLRQALSAPPS